MPLQPFNLDDRTFEQLLLEAKRRIPVYTPEWTNYDGDSDPGITIVQVFAFLTESLLYRANRIPDRDRIKFLQLLGIGLQPASASQGMIVLRPGRPGLDPLPLDPGVTVTAGNVAFLTLDGVDALPIEANIYYKSGISTDGERYNVLRTKYNAVLTALNAAVTDPDTTTPNTPAFYETASMQLPIPGTPTPVLDLKTDTLDRAIYLALLAPVGSTGSLDDLRSLISTKTLSIGIVSSSEVPPLRPLTPTKRTPSSGLIFEIADATNSSSQPAYARLNFESQPDVLREPGVVQVKLPAKNGLKTWEFTQPLTEGTLDYPPRIEDPTVNARIITWLRLRLPSDAEVSGGATSVPEAKLSWVGINATRIVQAITITNEPLGNGTGDPDQSVTLANTPVLPTTIQLYSQSTDGTNGTDQIWRLTDDLLAAGPNDAVYTLDPEAGTIAFGTGINGLRPQASDRLFATYQYGGGTVGNVGIGAIKASPDTRLQGGYTPFNPIPTWGGADGETQAQGEKSIPTYLRTRDRLVTRLDFADITRRTPGVAIGRVEVLPLFNPDETANTYPGTVTVMVIPQTDPVQPFWPVPDKQFIRTVCDYLDERRLVTTEIYVRGPVYVPIYISVGVQIQDGYFRDTVMQTVTQGLNLYLSSLPPGGNVGQGWPLNKVLLDKDLEAFVTRVPGIEYVVELLLQVGTSDAPILNTLNGLQLPQLVGLSVVEGNAVPIASITGNTPGSGGKAVPIPVSRAQC